MPQDKEKGIGYIKQAAGLGYAPALAVDFVYEKNEGNTDAAMDIYEKLLATGDNTSIFAVLDDYCECAYLHAGKKEKEELADYLDTFSESVKVFEDNQLKGEGYYWLARACREYGKDEKNAKKYFFKAGYKGYTLEKADLAFLGLDLDSVSALSLVKRAEKLGELSDPDGSVNEEIFTILTEAAKTEDAAALRMLAAFYGMDRAPKEEGRTGAQKAFGIYKKLADRGDAESLYHLGMFYEFGGSACKQDKAEAVRLYTLSFQKGCATGARKMGDIYFSGKLLPKDINTAIGCYLSAISLNQKSGEWVHDLSVKLSLGEAYEQKGDFAEALRWYAEAKDFSVGAAYYAAAVIYYNGPGNVPRDMAKAREQLSMAAERGNKKALDALADLSLLGGGAKQENAAAKAAGVSPAAVAAPAQNPAQKTSTAWYIVLAAAQLFTILFLFAVPPYSGFPHILLYLFGMYGPVFLGAYAIYRKKRLEKPAKVFWIAAVIELVFCIVMIPVMSVSRGLGFYNNNFGNIVIALVLAAAHCVVAYFIIKSGAGTKKAEPSAASRPSSRSASYESSETREYTAPKAEPKTVAVPAQRTHIGRYDGTPVYLEDGNIITDDNYHRRVGKVEFGKVYDENVNCVGFINNGRIEVTEKGARFSSF